MAVRKTLLTENPYAASLKLLEAQGHDELAARVRDLYERAAKAARGQHISPKLGSFTTWHAAKRVILDTPFIEKDEAEALGIWLFELGLAVAAVSKAQGRRPVALMYGRQKAQAVVKAGGNPATKVRLPEEDSALMQLLEPVL